MIEGLSDDNVGFLIELMQRFMVTERKIRESQEEKDSGGFMRELEAMRLKAKSYFPADFDHGRAWEEAMDEKYNSFD